MGDLVLLGDLQNPVRIQVKAEFDEVIASETVMASRSVVDNLPVSRILWQIISRPFFLLRDCSDREDPDDVFRHAARIMLCSRKRLPYVCG